MGPYDDENMRFHLAVEGNRVAEVKELLQEGADANARTRVQETPLTIAARRGFREMAEVLLEGGANVNAPARGGPGGERMSPLLIAAERGFLDVCQLLVQHGANPNAACRDGMTALNYAIHSHSPALVEFLLNSGADPNGSRKCYETPLMSAAMCRQMASLRMLLRAGADINLKGSSGQFPLMMSPNVDFARELLRQGADINQRDSGGRTVLVHFIRIGSPDLVRCYIEAGIDVNATDNEGLTALMLLTHEPRVEVAALLVAAGADVNAVLPTSRSVIDYIGADTSGLAGCRVRRRELLEYLRSQGARSAAELHGVPRASVSDTQSTSSPLLEPAATTAAFSVLVTRISEWCAAAPQPFEAGRLSGVTFAVPEAQARGLIAVHLEECQRQGAYLFQCGAEGGLALLPICDPWGVVEAMGTSASNYELDTPDIVAWLRELCTEQPFVLVGAGPDFVAGRFVGPVLNSRALARRIYEFCPDAVDQGAGSVAALAVSLKKNSSFFLWWD